MYWNSYVYMLNWYKGVCHEPNCSYHRCFGEPTAAQLQNHFALEGYHVLLHYNRDEDAVKKLCSLINESGFHAYCVKADLLNADDVKSLAQKANDACIDVLINNAGISDTLLFSEQNFENISRVINLDLTSAMQLTSLIIPMMINRKRGNIINISSMWGECRGFMWSCILRS